jgi:hypothetical protein
VIAASAAELAAVGAETIVEPTGADGLGAQLADALEEAAVGGDEENAGGGGRGLSDQSVVAAMSCVDDPDAIQVCLSDSGPGGAFDDDHYWQGKTPASGGVAELFNELERRAWPVPPPSSGPGPNHIGGVDHEHASRLARRARESHWFCSAAPANQYRHSDSR